MEPEPCRWRFSAPAALRRPGVPSRPFAPARAPLVPQRKGLSSRAHPEVFLGVAEGVAPRKATAATLDLTVGAGNTFSGRVANNPKPHWRPKGVVTDPPEPRKRGNPPPPPPWAGAKKVPRNLSAPTSTRGGRLWTSPESGWEGGARKPPPVQLPATEFSQRWRPNPLLLH